MKRVINTWGIFMLLLSLLCVIQTGKAQSPPTSFAFDPAIFSEGDTVSLIESVGTASEPVSNASEIEVIYVYDPRVIEEAPALSLDVSNSWFVSPEDNFDYQLELDESVSEIYLKITRNSGTASGHGEFARIGGLLIIEDIPTKIWQAPVRIKSVRVTHAKEIGEVKEEVLIFPNPASDYLNFWFEPEYEGTISLLDIGGKVLTSTRITPRTQKTHWDLSKVPPGTYVVMWDDKATQRTRKVIIH